MAKFTIVTNTIRRSMDLVEKSVAVSLAQDPSIDVVLVDQNEDRISLPPEIEKHTRFKHLRIVVPAVSQARNRAQYESNCEWLIFCDDDGYLDDHYYPKLLRLIQDHPDADIFAGSIRRTDTGDFYSKRHAIGGDMNRFWNGKLLMGSNFCVKREVFERLGKFDDSFGAGAKYGSSEETDFAWNAFFHGAKMVYAPELIVFHVPPFEGTLWPEMKKAFRYGRGKSALIRKWLLKGHPIVLLEAAEMFLVPWVRIMEFLLKIKIKEVAIQFAAVTGRVIGIFYV